MKHTLRQCCLVLLICSSILPLKAQELTHHIPRQAQLVVSIKGGELFQKIAPERILGMPMLKEMGERPGFDFQILLHPEEYGVNLYQSFHFFQDATQEITYTGMLIPLKSSTDFARFAEEQMTDTMTIEGDGYQYRLQGEGFIGWNSQFALLMTGNLSYNNPQIYELEYEEKEQLEQGMLQRQANLLFNLEVWNSIADLPDFKREFAKEGELTFWSNAGASLNAYNTSFMTYSPIGGMFRYLEEIYQNNYSAFNVRFDEGAIVADAQYYWNPRVKQLVEEVNKTKLNRNFLKYIPQQDLLGYMSFAFNSRNLWQEMQTLITPIVDSLPQMNGGVYSAMINALDIFIDEDAIYNMLPGNGLFMVSGIKTFETTYITYEYDDDFNAREITETKEEQLPEFTFMLSTHNEANVRKIMDFLIRIPGGVVAQEGLHYTFPEVKAETGFELYLSIADGIVFLTNNEDLVKNRLGTGYPSGERLGKTHSRQLKKNNQVVFWDLNHTLESIPLELMEGKPELRDMVMKGSETVGEMWLLSSNRKDPSQGSMRMTLKDPNQNAMDQLVDLLNELYLLAK